MKERRLTMDEVFLAQLVFKNSIDYQKVRIHQHRYMPLQPGHSGMTPNGEIYISGEQVRDYAHANVFYRAFFIHEMVHVWQKQKGVLNPIWSALGNSLRHGFMYSRAYRYILDSSLDLLDYRMEQQAQIIEDYYWLLILGRGSPHDFLQNSETGENLKSLYLSVLKKFLDNPDYTQSK